MTEGKSKILWESRQKKDIKEDFWYGPGSLMPTNKKKTQIIRKERVEENRSAKKAPERKYRTPSRRSKRKNRNRKFIKRAADERKAHRYKQKKNKKDTMRPLRHPEVCWRWDKSKSHNQQPINNRTQIKAHGSRRFLMAIPRRAPAMHAILRCLAAAMWISVSNRSISRWGRKTESLAIIDVAAARRERAGQTTQKYGEPVATPWHETRKMS